MLFFIQRHQLLHDQKIDWFLIHILTGLSLHFNTDHTSDMGCTNGAISLVHMPPAEAARTTIFIAYAVIYRYFFRSRQAQAYEPVLRKWHRRYELSHILCKLRCQPWSACWGSRLSQNHLQVIGCSALTTSWKHEELPPLVSSAFTCDNSMNKRYFAWFFLQRA